MAAGKLRNYTACHKRATPSSIFPKSTVAKLSRSVERSGFGMQNGAPARYHAPSSPGTTRRMNASNSGTVKPVSPCDGLYTMPLSTSLALVGATVCNPQPRMLAMSPERCGPGRIEVI